MREFVDCWAGRSGLAEMDEGLREFAKIVSAFEMILERDAAEKLLAALEKRGDCVIGELLLKGSVNFIAVMNLAPEELRPEMLKIYRDSMGKEFDPETEYRDSEAGAEKNQRDFEKAWGTFAADWPERATPELRERVHTVWGEPLGQWKGELEAKIAEFARAAG